MGKLLERLPIINIFDWADGDKYTVEENTAILTPELAESDKKTDELADTYFRTLAKGKSGKGRTQFKVEKEQLNIEKAESQEKVQEPKKEKSSKEMEIGE